MRIAILVVGLSATGIAGVPVEGGQQRVEELLVILQKGDQLEKNSALHALADLGPASEPAVPALVGMLKGAEPEQGFLAAIALAKIGKPAVKQLAAQLASTDDALLYYAVWALGLIGPDAAEAAPAIAKLSQSGNPDIRRKALVALLTIDALASVPVIFRALEDDDDGIRNTAYDAIWRLSEKAAPALVEALPGAKPQPRQWIARILLGMGPRANTASKELKALLVAEDPALVAAAAQFLANIGKEAVPILIEGADHPRPIVRVHSLEALAKFGDEAAPHVIKALDDKDGAVRAQAVKSLGALQVLTWKNILAFAEKLRDKDAAVRRAAVDVLDRAGRASEPALPDLIACVADEDSFVRWRCILIVASFGPTAKAAVPALKLHLLDANSNCHLIAAQALGKIGEASLPALVEGTKHPAPQVRRLALNTMAQIGPDAIPYLFGAMSDEAVEVRRQAAQDLARMPKTDKNVAKGLAMALADQDELVREAGVAGLQGLGVEARPFIPQLIVGLKDRSADVRWRCALVLGQIGPAAKEAVPALTQLLSDPHGVVSNYARWALDMVREKGINGRR